MKKLVFIFIIINSLIFTFLVPPFQKPDEDAHFYRSVALSRGQFYCWVNNKNEKVVSIPRKFYELPQLFHTEEMKFNSDRKFTLNMSDLNKIQSMDSSEMLEVKVPTCNVSYFIGYIPNTIGFLLAAPFDNLLVKFYFGRVAGFLFFILAFWYSLKIIPKPFHLILYLYGALPMVLHQVTSYSYDVVLLSMVPLVFSFLVKAYAEKTTSIRNFWFYHLSIFLLLLAKPISVPLVLLHLLFPVSKISRNKKKLYKLNIIFFVLDIAMNLLFLTR